MITKEKFYWVWRNSKRENILNQFYYEHYDLLEALKRIDKAIDYIKENASNFYLENPHYRGVALLEIEELLEILGDKENE